MLLVCLMIFLAGCSQTKAEETSNAKEDTDVSIAYTQITQDQAKGMMAEDDGHVVVDVRRQDEYDAGHIPGAILIPNESIETERPEELPDLNQIILIYCRSGNRSKQAAGKLAEMGYTNIYEFGGINTWTGEIVTESGEDLPDQEDADESGSLTEAEDPAEEQDRENGPKIIRVTDGTNTVLYQLNDTPPAVSLYEMLPIEAEVENYGSNEKIFYPETDIETAGGMEGSGEAGGLALFSPWGNVVMYYDSFDSYPGLYLLGEAVEGTDFVQNLSGTIRIEAAEE